MEKIKSLVNKITLYLWTAICTPFLLSLYIITGICVFFIVLLILVSMSVVVSSMYFYKLFVRH